MKKILYFSLILAAGLTACNDDYVDQFNIEYEPTDVKNMNFTLEDADYAAISSLETNKDIALAKDPEGQTFLKALSDVAKNKYFNENAPAEEYIPAFIASKFPAATIGSRYNVTYNVYQTPSGYLDDFNDLKEYTLSASDYKDVWGDYVKAQYLSPNSKFKLPEVLKKNIHGAAEGTVAVVNYAYSETEPSIGQEAPLVYKQVNEFDGQPGNYVIAAKGDDGKYYPFGKLEKESFGYGYMKPAPIEVENGIISTENGADQVVALEKTSKGFAMMNGWGKYIYMKGNYDSFNMATSVPSEGGDWTVKSNGDGTFAIKNVLKNKTVKLNYFVKDGKGSYSFGSYADEKFTGSTYYKGVDKETQKGNFTNTDLVKPKGQDYVWKFEDGSHGIFWKASGHVGGKDGSDEVSEGWLVSEQIDLSKAKTPHLSMEMVLNFLKGKKRSDYVNVYISDNYAGDVKTATWKEVEIKNWPKGSNYDRVQSGKIDLSSYKGKKINLAFKYVSTKEAAPTWQVSNIVVSDLTLYWDVCLFKEMTEDEAKSGKIMSRGLSRASEVAANTSALYTMTKDGWKEYRNNTARVIVLPQAAYDAAGSSVIADAENMLPSYLNVTYPIAKDGEKMAVVYNKSKDKTAVMEFTRKSGAWAMTSKTMSQTTTFLMDDKGISANMSIFLDCPFTDGAGDGSFVPYDVNLTGGLAAVWQLDDKYGWKASAYKGNKLESESWLVSPTMNFKKATAPQLVLEVALNKMVTTAKPEDHINIYVSKDFTGDVKSCTWDLLEYKLKEGADGYGITWTFFQTDLMDLTQYKGETNVVIGFCYKSTTESAPTFEMKNLKVAELTEFEK